MPTSDVDYPYSTHLNVYYPQQEVLDVPALFAAYTHP